MCIYVRSGKFFLHKKLNKFKESLPMNLLICLASLVGCLSIGGMSTVYSTLYSHPRNKSKSY